MGLRARARATFADTRPLQNPHFRRLWLANIVTVIGAQLTVVAVPAQIYAITRSSAMVGVAGLFALVPLVVGGLYGGALADHMDRRRLLVVTTTGIIAASALFCLQAVLDLRNVWLLLGILALQQAFFALNQPARAAILPRLIPPEQLPAGNALNMTVMQFGAIAGPLAGGALIPVLGYAALYAADTVLLLATLWAVVRLPAMPPTTVATGRVGLGHVLDGLRYLRLHTVLLMSFVVDLIAMVFGMPRALFPQVGHEVFGGPLEGGIAFALLMAAIPLGAALGGVFSGWVSRVRRQGLAVIVSVVVWGLGIGGAGLVFLAAGRVDGSVQLGQRGLEGTPALQVLLVLAVAALAVAGAADMASAAFRSTMLQEAAEDDVRGRLQGVFFVVVVGGPRIADVVHGGAGSALGPGVATAGGGLLVVVLVIVAALAVPAFVRYQVAR
ncbi:MFS transporter [Ornithinimicrobium humiphilum]|uniref:Transmembrane secretion effector n=1 Tax=Ornithinimicrobium humiphilum TaxID=125288 RepID=A0A543KQL3_9MICO|nr:MFS transporter [Ornithinimicrobium humiphilum]TQM97371.1 transmembrane secretion effector [Ornithinimicrobium humiphilum]